MAQRFQRRDSQLRHIVRYIVLQDSNHMVPAPSTERSDPVQETTTKEYKIRTKRYRSNNIEACSNATVEHYCCRTTHGFKNPRQRLNRCRCPVKLPTAVATPRRRRSVGQQPLVADTALSLPRSWVSGSGPRLAKGPARSWPWRCSSSAPGTVSRPRHAPRLLEAATEAEQDLGGKPPWFSTEYLNPSHAEPLYVPGWKPSP
jgi:hypothetical protein